METEKQSLADVMPAVTSVPAKKFEAARVRCVDGQEVPDYPHPFNSLADAEKYVADTPVSIDGTRPWIRNATSSRISGSFLMVGGRWLQSEPSGVFTDTTDETPMQNAMRGLERAVGTQHPQFDRENHRREVDCADTRLFDYWEWVVHQLDADETSVDDVIAVQEGRKPCPATEKLLFNGRVFVKRPERLDGSASLDTEHHGYFLRLRNGFQLFKTDGALEAFIVHDDRQGHFVVSASDTKNGQRYMFGTSSLTEKWLGLDKLPFSEKRNAVRKLRVLVCESNRY